jgi:hypothetical protein
MIHRFFVAEQKAPRRILLHVETNIKRFTVWNRQVGKNRLRDGFQIRHGKAHPKDGAEHPVVPLPRIVIHYAAEGAGISRVSGSSICLVGSGCTFSLDIDYSCIAELRVYLIRLSLL